MNTFDIIFVSVKMGKFYLIETKDHDYEHGTDYSGKEEKEEEV